MRRPNLLQWMLALCALSSVPLLSIPENGSNPNNSSSVDRSGDVKENQLMRATHGDCPRENEEHGTIKIEHYASEGLTLLQGLPTGFNGGRHVPESAATHATRRASVVGVNSNSGGRQRSRSPTPAWC
ncbi:hypothetical protein CRG98_038203 [Punica granatum]|uniref:Secreted protein n=1 Tax=Punica granatum TaxID=22663 RepID=A0A2I0IBQ4_PUNGR|nr:hypothetical protein CRG98_038203 [Punica granatum]